MADEHVSQTFSENPDPQAKVVSGDVITPFYEQSRQQGRLLHSLIEWLAHINRRYLALDREKGNDTGYSTRYCS